MKYEIKGEPMPVVICTLEQGESMITEKGSMVWMSPNLEMKTSAGGFGKAFSKIFSGESMFQNIYTANNGEAMIAFGSSFPGAIRAVEITPDKPVICQKSAFLASTSGVELSISFQKKFGSGFFGGEGFIMQKLSGSGIAFIEIDGTAVDYDLQPGQELLVSTGHVASMDSTVSIDVRAIGGAKNVFFGGEGLFNTVLTGPGKVTLQTMPISAFAATMSGYIGNKN